MSVRSGQPGINSNEYKKLPIILPSLDEQNKISNFLTSIDKKIDLLERKHQFYQEFKKFLMQQIFTQKLKFNELAKDYNHLLGDANSLSRINTFFNGKHKLIVKDKEPVELEEIEVEKEPTETIEYVPKDEVTLI